MDEADIVDEWFYTSINRYNKLQMYLLNETVNHIELSPNNRTICISNINVRTGRFQILEYELPSKYLDTSDNLCSTDHNLKIVCGTYLDHMVLELKILASSNQIVTVERRQSCINLYTLPRNDSDKISKTDSIPCDFVEPYMSSHPLSENLLAVSHFYSEPVFVLDISKKTPVHQIHLDDSLTRYSLISPNSLKTAFLEPNILCICLEATGKVLLYDLRCSAKPVDSSSCAQDLKLQGDWTMTTSSFSSPSINLISSNAAVVMVDPRLLSKPAFHSRLPIQLQERCRPLSDYGREHLAPTLEVCPHDSLQFSVSGFNENVHVFQRREENLCDEVFTHDAHPYQEHYERDVGVLSHKWMPGPYERMLLSSASNATLSCIQFNSK